MYTHLIWTRHFQVKEERNKQQTRENTCQTVSNGSHKQLSTPCVHLGRSAQNQYTADKRN